MATNHRSIQVYVFVCAFPNPSTTWQNDPSSLITVMRNAFSGVSGMTYKTLKISNVRNSTRVDLEVHLDGVLKNSLANLTSSEVDILRSDIITQLNTITNFTYSRVDVISNLFYEDPV